MPATTETVVKKSGLRDQYESLVVMLIFLNFVWLFVFQAFKIPTPSMVDNLLVGDHLFVNKFVYGPTASGWMKSLFGFRDIERGDIIVFRFPPQPEVDYVKRVVGLPGDVVTIVNKQVFINGKALPEPYVIFRDRYTYGSGTDLPDPYRRRDNFGPYVVPAGSYFAMGDNRDESYDSRYWGSVPRALIKGRPFMIYWSFRSETASENPSAGDTLRRIGDVVLNFFSKTRWDRMFFIVDSKYHYVEKE